MKNLTIFLTVPSVEICYFQLGALLLYFIPIKDRPFPQKNNYIGFGITINNE